MEVDDLQDVVLVSYPWGNLLDFPKGEVVDLVGLGREDGGSREDQEDGSCVGLEDGDGSVKDCLWMGEDVYQGNPEEEELEGLVCSQSRVQIFGKDQSQGSTGSPLN